MRVDLDALLQGRVLAGEACEIAGFGPVAVSAVRELLDTADPFLAAVVTKGVAAVGVAHLGRRPNAHQPSAHQQSALEWLYPTCAVEGCSSSTWLENDHRLDWATSRLSVLDLLDRLCPHHHDLKSLEGWRLVDGQGKRPFVPPTDPRHPRHANAPPAAARQWRRGCRAPRARSSWPTRDGPAAVVCPEAPHRSRSEGTNRCAEPARWCWPGCR